MFQESIEGGVGYTQLKQLLQTFGNFLFESYFAEMVIYCLHLTKIVILKTMDNMRMGYATMSY